MASTSPRAALHDFGCRAIAAFPLILEGRVLGTFALISTEPNTFDVEETDLLLQLAADTALGLQFIDKERQFRGSEEIAERFGGDY